VGRSAVIHMLLKIYDMAKTLPYENLDVGASEKTIQSILEFSKVTAGLPLKSNPKELEFFFQN